MLHNTIFIEGLPGSGKTTFALKLKDHLAKQGFNVKTYIEGDLHPLDLAWCSYCTKAQFLALLEKYDSMTEEIKKHTIIENNQYITAYTKINHPEVNQSFFSDWEQYEIYRIHHLKTFLDIHLKRWSNFSNNFDQQTIYIFECVYLQNHINELILTYDADFKTMSDYFIALLQQVKSTHPLILYIKQSNIDSVLDRIIDERRTEDPSRYRDWIDLVNDYVESTKYGPQKGFSGTDGFRSYLHNRQKMALDVLKILPFDHQIYSLDDDYDSVFEQIKKIF